MHTLDWCVDEAHPSGFDGGLVEPASLADHYRRVVDTDHQTPRRPGGESRQGDARPAAKLEHAVGRGHVKQGHRPPVALDVG